VTLSGSSSKNLPGSKLIISKSCILVSYYCFHVAISFPGSSFNRFNSCCDVSKLLLLGLFRFSLEALAESEALSFVLDWLEKLGIGSDLGSAKESLSFKGLKSTIKVINITWRILEL